MPGLLKIVRLFILITLVIISKILFAQYNDDEILDQPLTEETSIKAYKTIKLKPGFEATGGIKFTAKILSSGNPSYVGTETDIKNWAETKIYKESNVVVGHSKSYYDLMGKQVQSQSANLTDSKAVVSQTLYDAFGRAVISTLPAAISNSELAYKKGFVADFKGGDYTYEEFDGAKLEEPEVLNQAIENSLGWYYSNNNTNEPYVPASAYPYTRIEYSKITGAARRSALAGECHKMGTGHETMSFTMPASDEELLTVKTALGIELETVGLIKTVSVDAEDKVSVMYTNSDGNVIATCLGTGGTEEEVNHIIAKEIGYLDVYLSNTVSLPSGYTYTITNLENDESAGLGSGFYRIAVNETLTTDLTIPVKIANSHYALNVYDKVGRLIESYSPKAVANNDPTLKTTYTYNVYGWLTETTSPDEGTTQYVYRKDGSIRFSQNSQQADATDGVSFSYTHYDDAGRIIEVGEYFGSIAFSPGMDAEMDKSNFDKDYCRDTTLTMYDIPDPDFNVQGYTQNFVAGNVSRTWNRNTTTWYSYRYDGKIDWIAQDIIGLGLVTIDYSYDFNGNVTAVIYEKNNYEERFDHLYTYDDDLRLSQVNTVEYNPDGSVLKNQVQAKYEYYAHGPLKRVELGGNLQGVDYTYTINGWLKSINDPSLIASYDPGNDGNNSFEPDLFGMSLDYYSGDYTRSGTNIESTVNGSLYDGNIKAQRWQTRTTDAGMNPGSGKHWISTYTYNNLNYLQNADFGTYTYGSNSKSVSVPTLVDLTYDANGNIDELNRYSVENGQFDQFAYTYGNGNNQLTALNDAAGTVQVNGQDYTGLEYGDHLFEYDAIGQMTQRNNTGLTDYYKYNVYGKVTGIYEDLAHTTPIVEYFYDDKGFRIKKDDYVQNTETWYVRDASGNILSVYTADNGGAIEQTELPVYGSGRIGVNLKNEAVEYEITDHLGNVRVTFGENTSGNLQLNTYADYYPFGMKMAGRTSGAGTYRFGYQGQFAEDETEETGYNAFEARLWDSRIARWTTIDPAGQFYSPYLGMGNNPISLYDPNGEFVPFKNVNNSFKRLWNRAWGFEQYNEAYDNAIEYGMGKEEYFDGKAIWVQTTEDGKGIWFVANGYGLKQSSDIGTLFNAGEGLTYLNMQVQDRWDGSVLGLWELKAPVIGGAGGLELIGGIGPLKTAKSINTFRSFTRLNYRHNLKVFTGIEGVGMDAHHIYPQAKRFQKYWKKIGLNIHDPKYLRWWERSSHRKNAKAFNKMWDEFFEMNPDANFDKIMQFGDDIMNCF